MEEESNTTLIRADNVSKFFPLGQNFLRLLTRSIKDVPHHVALKEVSCEVKSGEFLGILGRNGAGKSTFLRILGDIYAADSGIVSAFGDRFGIYELGGGANPGMTGRNYARWWVEILGVKKVRRKELIRQIGEFSELEEYFDQPVRTYSSGMKARLYFSAVTTVETDILLIDEALAVGDEHFQRKCWDKLREKVANGASGVLVSHDWVSVLRLCHRAIILKGGELVGSKDSRGAVQEYLETGTQAQAEKGRARFADSCLSIFEAESGKPFRCKVPVRIEAPGPVEFGYSIEYMKPGWGWNILLMGTGILVGEEPGTYEVGLFWEDFPIAQGEYEFSFFLSQSDSSGHQIALDQRGWLSGIESTLRVQGPDSAGAVCFLKKIFEYDGN